jgi:hypothetical protein
MGLLRNGFFFATKEVRHEAFGNLSRERGLDGLAEAKRGLGRILIASL